MKKFGRRSKEKKGGSDGAQGCSPLAGNPDEFLIAITNNISGAVIVIDEGQQIFHYNAAALDILNTNVNLVGRDVADILGLEDKDGKSFDIRSFISDLCTVETLDDMRFYAEPDEAIRLEVTISPIRTNFTGKTNTTSGYVLSLRDVTRAKSLDEERDEFIGVVSHELRTPTAIIEGTISNLRVMVDKGGELDRKELKKTLEVAHNQVKSLSGMINSLSALSHSEMETGVAVDSLDLAEVLAQLEQEYAPHAKKKSLAFESEVKLSDATIATHRPYLEEIVRNFITNAIKYTPSGKVTLRASDTPESIMICVEDTGTGISRAEQKKIFDKFYRVENERTRSTDGVGLGLYITFKLAKKLRGEIKLESEQGKGSKFSVILPRTLATGKE